MCTSNTVNMQTINNFIFHINFNCRLKQFTADRYISMQWCPRGCVYRVVVYCMHLVVLLHVECVMEHLAIHILIIIKRRCNSLPPCLLNLH